MAEFENTIAISQSALRAQTLRMRLIAENLANANTVTDSATTIYRRKVPVFKTVVNQTIASGNSSTTPEAGHVQLKKITVDNSSPVREYSPAHPMADAQGYITKPNINPIIESTDMREAQRSYEANLNVIDSVKNLSMRTIDLLK